MNREILFRGKRIGDGQWVYGGIYIEGDRTYIVLAVRYVPDTRDWDTAEFYERNPTFKPTYIEVDPATVGQFTGEKDRNGNRIFEGDILEVAEGRYDSVSFSHGCFWMDRALMFGEFSYGVDEYKVVGNIHDHPSLLQG